MQSPFSKVINNTDGSYVCRRTNNITCTRFKLQMHFYILCTTWTALSNLMRKKKIAKIHPNLLEQFNTTSGKQEDSMHWNRVPLKSHYVSETRRAFIHLKFTPSLWCSLQQFNHFNVGIETTEMAVLVKDMAYCHHFFPDSTKVIIWVFILILLNPSKLYEFTD